MTREQMIDSLRALDTRLSRRVTIVRVVVNEQGEEIARFPTGSFEAPPDFTPPVKPV
jgi:hypothetical protein